MTASDYLEDALRQFHGQKKLAERALAQVTDKDLFVKLDEESNSIALIVKHLAGNMRSRWTDFLASEGEKADRDRDSESKHFAAGDWQSLSIPRGKSGEFNAAMRKKSET